LKEVELIKAVHTKLLEAIEEERRDQIDGLRKQMLREIKEVRSKNSVTNEEQLQGTTKLTVI